MKLSDKLIVAAIVCFAAVSCTDKKPDNVDSRESVVFRNASARYYGATENSEAYFTMDLTDGGKKLHLEFYGDPVGDYDVPELRTGDYSLATGSATEAGTYIPGSGDGGCIYSETTGADVKLYNIAGGVFSIRLSETTYNVTLELKDHNGNDLKGSYTGPVTVEDMRGEIPNDFASGFADFYGKKISIEAHLFLVRLNSDGIVWDSSKGTYTGTGYGLSVSVMAETGAFTEISDGTYTVAASATPGGIFTDSDNTCYVEVVGDVVTKKPLTSGTVTFRRSGDIYTVVTDVTDSDGNNYKKYYKGELEYRNRSDGFVGDFDIGSIVSGKMAYFGKTDDNAYNFEVTLLGDGMSMDTYGSITGSGYTMVMDIYSELNPDADITPATYSVTDTRAPGTIYEGLPTGIVVEGSHIDEFKDGQMINTVCIKGGTATISGAYPDYDIQTAFKCPNGFDIAGSYNGKLVFFDESSGSITLPDTSPADRYRFTSFSAVNYGDYYRNGTTNFGLSFEHGDIKLWMDVITTETDSDNTVPAGTYTLDDTHLANTFTDISYISCQDYFFSVKGGTMSITDLNDEGDRIYTFDFDMGEKGMFYAEYEYSVN